MCMMYARYICNGRRETSAVSEQDCDFCWYILKRMVGTADNGLKETKTLLLSLTNSETGRK